MKKIALSLSILFLASSVFSQGLIPLKNINGDTLVIDISDIQMAFISGANTRIVMTGRSGDLTVIDDLDRIDTSSCNSFLDVSSQPNGSRILVNKTSVLSIKKDGAGAFITLKGGGIIKTTTLWASVIADADTPVGCGGSGGGGGATNLSTGTRTSTTFPINNSNGTGVTIDNATIEGGTNVAGLMTPIEKGQMTQQTIAYSATISANLNNGNRIYVDMTGDAAIAAPSNSVAGEEITYILTANGANRTATFASVVFKEEDGVTDVGAEVITSGSTKAFTFKVGPTVLHRIGGGSDGATIETNTVPSGGKAGDMAVHTNLGQFYIHDGIAYNAQGFPDGDFAKTASLTTNADLTPNLSTGLRYTWSINGNYNLQNPTFGSIGRKGVIAVTNTAGTASTITTVGGNYVDENYTTVSTIVIPASATKYLTFRQTTDSVGPVVMLDNVTTINPPMGGDLSGTASNAQIVANAVGWTELSTHAKDSLIQKETLTDTIVPYPSEMTFRPFDIVRNGSTYSVSSGFSLQERAGVVVSKTYYVDINTGNDGNAGTTWGTALKSIHVALAKTDVDRIYVAKGIYPYSSAWRNQTCTRDVEVIGDLTQGVGDSVYVTKRMTDKLLGSWTAASSYYFRRYTISGDTASLVFDASNLDAYGDPTLLTNVASVALVNSTANSYRISNDTIYVHTFDNRAPDSDIWVIGKNASISNLNGTWNSSKRLYVKNLNWKGGSIYTSGAVGSSIYLEYVNTWLGGAFFDGMTEVILKNCVFRRNSGDLLNYDPESGTIPNVAEINVKAYYTTDAACTNCQASTAHGGTSIIRINGYYADTYGQNVADVDGGKTLMYGCTFDNAIPASSQGYYAGGASGYSWLERCTFVNQQASNDDIYAESGHQVFTRFITADEGNAGPGTFASYSPSETFTNKTSGLMQSAFVYDDDVLYIAKKHNSKYLPAKISGADLFANSGALFSSGSVEGATTTAQQFRKAVQVNGSTGGAVSAKALSATTPALKLESATGQTGNRFESYNSSGVLDFIQESNGDIHIGDGASELVGNFSVNNNTGNLVYTFGGPVSSQQVRFRIRSGALADTWTMQYQGTADAASLLYTRGGTERARLTTDGVFSATLGFRVNNAAPLGNYLRGNGTNFVASTIQIGDLPTMTIAKGGTGLTALGTANQLLRVNAGATALEYFTPSYLTSETNLFTPGGLTNTAFVTHTDNFGFEITGTGAKRLYTTNGTYNNSLVVNSTGSFLSGTDGTNTSNINILANGNAVINSSTGNYLMSTAPQKDSDVAGDLQVRDGTGFLKAVDREAFEILTGTGAPVNGTTTAYEVGQIYIDVTNAANPISYYASTKSTDPDAAATGSVWNRLGYSTVLADADNDTKIQVEETADEDIIRMDAGGNEVAQFYNTRIDFFRRQSIFGSGALNAGSAAQTSLTNTSALQTMQWHLDDGGHLNLYDSSVRRLVIPNNGILEESATKALYMDAQDSLVYVNSSGTWTPTLTLTGTDTVVVNHGGTWSRSGNTITYSLSFAVGLPSTAQSNLHGVQFTLPVSSTLTTHQIKGTASMIETGDGSNIAFTAGDDLTFQAVVAAVSNDGYLSYSVTRLIGNFNAGNNRFWITITGNYTVN